MCGTGGTDLNQISRGFSHVKIFKQDHSLGMGKLVPNPNKLGTNDSSLWNPWASPWTHPFFVSPSNCWAFYFILTQKTRLDKKMGLPSTYESPPL